MYGCHIATQHIISYHISTYFVWLIVLQYPHEVTHRYRGFCALVLKGEKRSEEKRREVKRREDKRSEEKRREINCQ
jgi:hypothetical protein